MVQIPNDHTSRAAHTMNYVALGAVILMLLVAIAWTRHECGGAGEDSNLPCASRTDAQPSCPRAEPAPPRFITWPASEDGYRTTK